MANNKKMTREEVILAAKRARSICFNIQTCAGEFGTYTTIIDRKQFDNLMSRMHFKQFYAETIGDTLYIGKQQ